MSSAIAELMTLCFSFPFRIRGRPQCLHQCIHVTFPVLSLQVHLHQPLPWKTGLAVGTSVACDSVNQALNCHWALACRSPADALVLAANTTAYSIASLFSTKRNSEGPRFCIQNECSGEFLFRPSDHHPNVSTSSIEAALFRGLTTQTNGLTATRLHSLRAKLIDRACPSLSC